MQAIARLVAVGFGRTIPEYVSRWKASTLTERAAAQSHFKRGLAEVNASPVRLNAVYEGVDEGD